MLTGSIGFTVINTESESAGLPKTHIAPDATLQFTLSPLDGMYVKKSEFVPEFIPFTVHWKVGENPAFVAVAVNITDMPWQTLLLLSFIEIPICTKGSTAIGIELEVAGLPVAHTALLDVITQLTTSLFNGIYENKDELFPTCKPLTIHW
jgi:hypothetical protein